MNYPTLNEIANTRQMLSAFRGYNHNLRISEGEFYDMQNLTSTHYPVLSPRGKRGILTVKDSDGNSHHVTNPKGMIAKDSLCYVVDGKLYINHYEVPNVSLTDGDKNLVSMGAYVVIFPDGVWVNTANFKGEKGVSYGSVNAKFENETYIKFVMCGSDGKEFDFGNRIGNTKPEGDDIKNGDYWLDTSSTPHSVKVYSSSSNTWTSVATTYVKIYSPGIGNDFNQYDGITISGFKTAMGDGFAYTLLVDYNTGDKFEDEQLADLQGSAVIWDKGSDSVGDYILVVGLLDVVRTIRNKITIERKMPAMDTDLIIESGNRLWGCRYGTDNNGKVVNEIYASKLGDFKNWNCFMQVSTDSCVLQCGTDGQFTGAVTHLGYPIFFKENCMHKVYGNYPANYQTQTTECRGVQKGCGDSLAIVNEVLYYKSRNGICAYDGSLPVEVSYALGEVSYDDAVACGYGNKYYVSMRDTAGKYHLFVYDAAKDMWHREDDLAVKAFCSCRNELYYYERSDSDSVPIKTLFGSGDPEKAPVSWMAETGTIGVDSPDKKYISKLNIRLSLDVGTRIYIYIQYDSMGDWERAATITGTTLRSFTLPVRPKRCDHMRIRIVGEGDAKIYSITKTIEQGSDS